MTAYYGPPPHLYEMAPGLSEDLIGRLGAANQACRCSMPGQSMLCSYGHMLECHYPMTCEEAHCTHYEAQVLEEQTP